MEPICHTDFKSPEKRIVFNTLIEGDNHGSYAYSGHNKFETSFSVNHHSNDDSAMALVESHFISAFKVNVNCNHYNALNIVDITDSMGDSVPDCVNYYDCNSVLKPIYFEKFGFRTNHTGAVYFGPSQKTIPDDLPAVLTAAKIITDSGIPNHMGAKIPVSNNFNIPLWHRLLSGYKDKRLLEYLVYGFPMCASVGSCQTSIVNHSTAERFHNM